MKKIRKRIDGRWEARITIDGKRKSFYAKTQKECYNKLKDIKNSLKSNIQTKNVNASFYDFALTWLDRYKKSSVSKTTYEIYENTVKTHLVKLKTNIKQITTGQLQDFLNSLGPTRTKEMVYLTIKQIFKKALELDIIKKDISQFLVKGRIDRKVRTSFSVEEQKKILGALKHNTVSKYILAYLMLGARLSELSSIKKQNIRNNFVKIIGSKTKNAERWVKISDRYQEILLSYSDPIFNCQPDTIKAKMKEFFAKIGIKGSAHRLRHTFSTNLYYLGADDNTRKQFMGHGSIMVTNDIYTHLDPSISKNDILNLYKDLYPKFWPQNWPHKLKNNKKRYWN